MIFIGIDPGASGGIVVLTDDSDHVFFKSMPKTEELIWDWASKVCLDAQDGVHDAVAAIEQVQGFIGEGHPGSGMFKFGMNYGMVRMAMTAAGIPYQLVTPQTWQKGLGIKGRSKGESNMAWKRRLMAEASRRMPRLKLTLATADAVLITLFLRETYDGKRKGA